MSLSPSNYNGAQLTTPYSTLSSASYIQASAKTDGNTASPPAPDYTTSGLTHSGLLSRDVAPATSPNTIQTNSTMLATSSITAPTDTTPSAAAHMPSYGGALAASSSAYALGGPYSGYPYANLAGTATGAADVWGATNGSSAAYGATAGAYSSYAGGDYAGTTPFSGSYPPYYSEMNDGVRRKNATRESTNTLKAWLNEHKKNPYPTKGEKIMLAIITKMTLTQVSTWFANARRRLKKENKMTWVPKNRPENDDDENSDKDADEKDEGLGDSNTVSFGNDEDKDRLQSSRTYASPGVTTSAANGLPNGAGGAYASPVASLQTWVNGFAPPTSESSGVKTEGTGASGDPGINSPSAGVNGDYSSKMTSDGTSTNVSPLSSTLSSSIPYSGTVSASQLHPSAYASAASASAYETTAAHLSSGSYYPSAGYYHPSALTSMDPYAGAYSAAGSGSNPGSTVPFAQKF